MFSQVSLAISELCHWNYQERIRVVRPDTAWNPNTHWRVWTRRLDSPEAYERTKYNWQKIANEIIPNDNLLYS